MSKKKDSKFPSPVRKYSELPTPISAPDFLDHGKQSLVAANDQLNIIMDKVGNVF
jgi:hypothetical protein